MELSIILISLCFVISLSSLGCDCGIQQNPLNDKMEMDILDLHGYIVSIRTEMYHDQRNRDELILRMNETIFRCCGKCGTTENKKVYDSDSITTIKNSMHALQRGLREEKRIRTIMMSKTEALQEENEKLNQALKTMNEDKTESMNMMTETLKHVNDNVNKVLQVAMEDRNKLMAILADIQNLKQENKDLKQEKKDLNLALKDLNEKIKVESNAQMDIMSRIEMIQDDNQNLSQALAVIKEVISFNKGLMTENGKPKQKNETLNQEMTKVNKVPEVMKKNMTVIHYSTNYKLDFNAAKTYCESRGTSVATYEDLEEAYKDGYQKCACGWAANGIAYIVMQAVMQGCSSSIGVVECSWQSTWDVFCKRRLAPVIHYSTNYKLDFNASKTYCESRGTSVATYEDLEEAYKDGYQKCACGWAANGIAYIVMQAVMQGCSSSIGVVECSWQSTWDVFCKRRLAPVIHYSTNYKLDFNASKTYCESRGTSVATYEDLDGAYKDGYQKCACGWAANGIAYIVMQAVMQGCSSSIGVVECSWQSTWDVFCKRRLAPVIHYSTNYKLDFNASKTYCESRGTSVATYEDLEEAYKDGYQKCACGWAANGIAYIVMQAVMQGCSSSIGVVECSWQSTWDVFCKRRLAPVIHYSTNYKLDFNASKTYCESRGTSVATYEDLDGAYKDKYQKCACGWAANGIAYIVMQAVMQGCSSSIGVVECSWQSTWDVFCKRRLAPGVVECSWQSTWDVFCKRRLAPVIHYSTNYKLDFNASKTYCESRGTSVATYEDLDGAYKDGYQKCACGWAANGIAYIVMQAVMQGCSSSIGVVECSWQSTWDVFCKRRLAPVIHYSTNYKLDFNASKTYCESRGTSVATYEDLEEAYKDGYQKCACGWAANGIAYIVMQAVMQGCSSSIGVVECSWQSTWDVFCKRRLAPVIHYSTNYKLDFNASKTYCESRGTSVATYEDLDGAYKDKYQKCACGWAANGIAYIVMQAVMQGCSSSIGVVECSWQSTWDVFCKRRLAPVIHYSTNYKLDFNASKTYCESRGTSVATYEDLDGAYKDGYQKCACGWAANGIAYIVMQAVMQGCSSSIGVVECSWQSTWDVFCKRRLAPGVVECSWQSTWDVFCKRRLAPGRGVTSVP